VNVQFEEKLAMVRKDDYRKMTREMMDVMFSQAELQTSSVTGRKGAALSSSKPCLDANKSAYIM